MGDLALLERMVSAAAEAGATHAKFQTWHVADLLPGPWDQDGRREIYQSAELSREQFQKVKQICNDRGVAFLTSLFNPKDVDPMAELSNQAIKIPSMELHNQRLLELCRDRFQKVYLSTGACTEAEIDAALEILRAGGCQVVLMHCVSVYPTPDELVNLPRIKALQQKHPQVGLSDHTTDPLSALLTLPLGVVAIEKHFTIDRNLPGRDNLMSLLPPEFAAISEACRRFPQMNQDHGVDYQPQESEVRTKMRGRWGGGEAV